MSSILMNGSADPAQLTRGSGTPRESVASVTAGSTPLTSVTAASEAEIRELARLPLDELKALARRTADRVHGPRVLLRGLIEVTNHCAMDCLYCGIRRSNTKAVRYRLSHEELAATIAAGRRAGFMTFVLQGGGRPGLKRGWPCAPDRNRPDRRRAGGCHHLELRYQKPPPVRGT